MLNGSIDRVFVHFLFIKSERGSGSEPPAFGNFGNTVYYQYNPFLGMFQVKILLKAFETCSLFYVSVLNVAF